MYARDIARKLYGIVSHPHTRLRELQVLLDVLRHRDLLPDPSHPANTTPYGTGPGRYEIYDERMPATPIIYSAGVGSEISFDLAIISKLDAVVHAFDPTYQAARFVHEQNVPAQFKYHRVALSDRDGTAEFRSLKKPSTSYFAGSLLPSGDRPDIHVQTRSLASVMSELGHSHIDVLKLDIEGAEYSIIDHILDRHLKVYQIVLEFHPYIINLAHTGRVTGRRGWEKTAMSMQSLAGRGYQLLWRSSRGTEFTLWRPDVHQPTQR